MRDATLEFRLSVYNAKPADEGLYTCTTPKNMVMIILMIMIMMIMMIMMMVEGLKGSFKGYKNRNINVKKKAKRR